MTFAELLPFLAQGGVVAGITWVLGLFHRSAIRAHERRADDWRAAYDAERARADEATRQLAAMLGAVKAGAS